MTPTALRVLHVIEATPYIAVAMMLGAATLLGVMYAGHRSQRFRAVAADLWPWAYALLAHTGSYGKHKRVRRWSEYRAALVRYRSRYAVQGRHSVGRIAGGAS
jgi:hypothetical protein